MTDSSAAPSSKGALARDLLLYTAARLGLIAVIAAIIYFGAALVNVEIPLLVAMVFALVIAFPLSIVLFKKLRVRVNEDISAVDEQRRRAREDLHAKLRGDQA